MSRRKSDPVPDLRIRALNTRPISKRGKYVLYWMTAQRRCGWNFALDRAIELSQETDRPLVILEALRLDYPWSSARIHDFVMRGMADNAEHTAEKAVTYFPYVESTKGEGKGLLQSLGKAACVVVTDDFPCFFIPRMAAAAANVLDVRLEAVDSNGLYPLAAADRSFTTAFSFRAHLQKHLPPHLAKRPRATPFRDLSIPSLDRLPTSVTRRWPATPVSVLADGSEKLGLRFASAVPPCSTTGGTRAAGRCLRDFLGEPISRYDEDRNAVEASGTSGLSPYLHFGHISAHQIFHEITKREQWTPESLDGPKGGKREGYWNLPPAVEGFLDQIITWRELGYQFCARHPDYDTYESLPQWARTTLQQHSSDPRDPCHDLGTLESARTYDDVWNAAQRQLLIEGRMHNYLRMLWGKKILEWSETPQKALEVMIHLNNKYALDGRNPNSYSGIFWTLGRFDRAWGPERPIFGKVRYMSSDSTRRKLKLKPYLNRYADLAIE